MKIIRLNKTGRQFWRTTVMIFVLWMVYTLYYYATWKSMPTEIVPPLTTEVKAPNYDQLIARAGAVFKNVSRRIDVPSVSLAVGHKGKLIWTTAEGYQDIDQQIPATPKTQYRIGSTSKSVTATAIALAVQENLLDLDAPITEIDNWPSKPWDFSMRQLLSHTAGIGNYMDFGIKSAKYTLCNCFEFQTATEGLKVFNDYDMLYQPGTDFAYSTFDVNLASAILEQRVQSSFPEYVKQTVFEPLEMHSSYADHHKPKSKAMATFYQTDNEWYREYRSFGLLYDINLSYKWAGGGFISTPEDLVKLGNAWVADSTFLEPDLRRQFWTPVRLDNGEMNAQEYAVGFRSNLHYSDDLLSNTGQTFWIVHHGGVSKGSQNFLLIFPNYELVIDAAINANVAPFSKLSNEVKKIAAVFLAGLDKKETQMFRLIEDELAEQ